MPNTRVKGPQAYADIAPTIEDAFYRGGGRITCATDGEAVRLVQRMNQFRIMDRRLNHEIAMKRPLPDANIDPSAFYEEKMKRDRLQYLWSRYDTLIFRRQDNTVLIDKRPERPYLKYTDLDGNPIDLDKFDSSRTFDTGESMPADLPTTPMDLDTPD